MWPRRKPKLQLYIFGIILCVLLERALIVLAPQQLGLLIRKLEIQDVNGSLVALALYASFEFLISSAGITWIRKLLWIPVELNASAAFDIACYNHIMNLSCDFHDSKQSGDLYSIISQGSLVAQLFSLFLFDIFPTIADLLIACSYFYVLFSFYLALIGVATGALYIWVSIHRSPSQRIVSSKSQKAEQRTRQTLYDTMGSWRTVIYFNRLLFSQKMYAENLYRSQRAYIDVLQTYTSTWCMQGLVVQVGQICAMCFATFQIIKNGQRVENLVTLLVYWSRFTGILSQPKCLATYLLVVQDPSLILYSCKVEL
jgi:ABC-type transport system involved in Fe-S cluster assembly fused permease/ATPase subunit